MRDIIKKNLLSFNNNELKFKMLREYLQTLVLKFIEQKGYSKNIAFVGGTALRFLYNIGRFSEDLDFSLTFGGKFNFETFLNEVQKYFGEFSIQIETKPKKIRTVNSSFLKFSEILHENGLTQRKDQKLFIKMEVDLNPPAGFVTDISFIQGIVPMNVIHYNISSLFAGKLHAILLRQYTKGRDFYDLMWFLGQNVVPNYTQLQNAVCQTTGQREKLNAVNLKERLKKRIGDVKWSDVVDEVGEFLVNRDEVRYLTADVFNQIIDKAIL